MRGFETERELRPWLIQTNSFPLMWRRSILVGRFVLSLSLFLHCLKFNLCFFFFSGFLVHCFAMLCYAVLCCAVLHLNEFVIRGNLLEMKWELIFVNVSSFFFFFFFFSISIYRKI